MAFDASQEQQDELNQAQGQGQAGVQAQATQAGQETNLSGGGGGFAGPQGSGSGPGGASQPGQTSSGSWTNLNNYISANADQSQSLGNQVAGNVETQAKTAQQDLGGLATAFQNQDPYKTINAVNSDQVTQAFSDPSQYATGDTSKALQYLNGSYGTPTTDIQSYQPTTGPAWSGITSEFNHAGTNLQNTQSESGRYNLLQDQYGHGPVGYNQGEQSFDQLLLGQDPGNQQKLNSLYQQYAPQIVTPQAATGTDQASKDQSAAAAAGIPLAQWKALNSASQYTTDEQNKAQGYQTQAQGLLNQDIQSLQLSLQSEEQQKAKDYGAESNQLENALQTGVFSPDQASELGINLQTPIYNLDRSQLASFLSVPQNPYSGPQAANYAASANDWAQFKGLQNLINGTNNNADLSSSIQGVGLTGAPQDQVAASSPYTFNKAGFDSAISNAQAGYQQNLQDFMSKPADNPFKNDFNNAIYGQNQPLSINDMQKFINNVGSSGNPALQGIAKNYADYIKQQTEAFNLKQGRGNTLGAMKDLNNGSIPKRPGALI